MLLQWEQSLAVQAYSIQMAKTIGAYKIDSSNRQNLEFVSNGSRQGNGPQQQYRELWSSDHVATKQMLSSQSACNSVY